MPRLGRCLTRLTLWVYGRHMEDHDYDYDDFDSGWEDDGHYDDDPSPYDGTYSEE